MTDDAKVKAYYDRFDEWARLDTPEGRLEFDRALKILEQYLNPGSRILDLGCGPGRYAIALAKRNHRIVLADLSNKLLDKAKIEIEVAGVGDKIESIDQVNALCLSIYPPNSFDAVIAFGPFYHLTQSGERESVASEIARVLKNDGFVFVSFIPRLSGLMGLIVRASEDPEQVNVKTMRECLSAGIFRNPTERGFQEGYFPLIPEIEILFKNVGITPVSIMSLRGLANSMEDRVANLDPQIRNEILDVVEKTSTDRHVVACCGHAVYIGRKN